MEDNSHRILLVIALLLALLSLVAHIWVTTTRNNAKKDPINDPAYQGNAMVASGSNVVGDEDGGPGTYQGSPPSNVYYFYKAGDGLINATADELAQSGWKELEVVENDGLYSTEIGDFDFNPGRVFLNETRQYVAITDYEIGAIITDDVTGIISNMANETC